MKRFLTLAMLLIMIGAQGQDYKKFPMWNTNLSFDERVNDLVSRLTLEEKVAQMLNAAPAVPRLGIAAYDWWNETLHGVARTPFPTTSFPQAIGMAATWDIASMQRMGDISSTEGRAIHNQAVQENRTGERYLGLTYWTPNINIFRDPRWGRGQETYGEDPFLTASLGNAFVVGLQGTNPKYLKAAACAKHFAVHSGPEPSRHADNFNPTPYDLWDTYLPAFQHLVKQSKVAGVMCAYNALYTQPCCASDLLMNDILRNQWKFTGYVTSDCGAIDDFFYFHKTHKDATLAAVDAVYHGTDVECGNTAYLKLVDAVKSGLIKQTDIDVSLKRLFTIRFRLGMFDPPSMVPYAQTPVAELESPEHQAHALKMARQSIVLLKNENNTLPLKKNLKKIAILGPNADNEIAVLGNYNGSPTKVVSVLEGIKAKLGNTVELIQEQAINYTNDTLLQYTNISQRYETDGKPGVKVAYFNNVDLTGQPSLETIEKDINFYRTEGQPPASGLNWSHYSARFSTAFMAEKSEYINFEAKGDDGYKIFINDSLLLNAWSHNNRAVKQFRFPVQKGMFYKIRVEFFQRDGNAEISLRSGEYAKTDFAALAKRLANVDAIIFVGGISPQLEGEEMPVAVPGFKGGDRTSIALPAIQTELMKALKTTGKPVAFVMMTGSALAIPWESENIPAIVNAWYGGQSAGTAVADVLFGDYNPAGRLPVTFYKSDNDLPAFGDYAMEGRTYRYFRGDALYPFGYGLSYTRFNYSNLNLPTRTTLGKNVTVTIQVKNTGGLAGEEVVQLYVSHPGSQMRSPIRSLKDFKRIFLKAGETKLVKFTLTPDKLSLIDEKGKQFQPKGKVLLSVGGGQPGIKNKTSGNVASKTIVII